MQNPMEKLKEEGVRSYVPSVIPSISEVVIVGEFPEKYDALTKAPFSSSSGKLLKVALQQAGFPIAGAHQTYVLKDMDKEWTAYIKPPKNSRSSPQWEPRGSLYNEILRAEISISPAKLIIAVGNVALCALTGRWGIHKWRGSLLKCLFDESKYVLPILSPSQCLHTNSEFRHLILHDLKTARRYLDNGFAQIQRCTLTQPSFSEAVAFLAGCYEKGLSGHSVTFDIEIKHLELNCISFCCDFHTSMSIPFIDAHNRDYFTPVEEVEIMKWINRILSNSGIRKLGQNLIFDTHFLLRKYGIRTKCLDDTMIAQHTLLPQLEKGLAMITSLWTDQCYYKDEGKEWMKGKGSYEQLWVYNCLDSAVCAEAFPKIMQDLVALDNVAAYERQLSIVEPCCYMMERGISVDMAGLQAERERMRKEVEMKQAKLAELAPGLNPQSPKQLQQYFYGTLGIKPLVNKKRQISVDGDNLKRIARRKGEPGSEEAKLILDIKKNQKLISTYMEDVKFDKDNRIRCSYNPCGTTYSRLSSSQSIFGTGMNMQNWPHSMLKHLRPDPGYVMYGLDLSQAENRLVAYIGRILSMIDAFETGKDVHRLTASLIFKKPPEEISDEPGSCSLGNGDSTERQWGKKANHGLNYDLSYKSFALYYDMPEKEAKFIVDSYHEAYPEVRRNFHAYVRSCLQKDRTITNLMGRKTLFLTDLDDSTFKAAYSCIPQGTVGDIINERGMAYLYYNKLFKPVELLQQVHDSITIQIPLDVPWQDHAYMLKSLKDSLEQPLTTHYGRSFVIPADIVMGDSLMKENGIEFKAKKFPTSIEEFAIKLEEAWETLKERRGYE